ncbi:MAG: hypothetical protein IT285_00945 [Bdellovibrionales bacterium]|nr:hypothetical protein [Bdellovibrionales bacterium]
MREDYKIGGATAKVDVMVEKGVAENLQKMADYTKLSVSEIANTALKRFISTHKDFLPPPPRK